MSEVSEFFKWDCKTQEITNDVWRNAPHMITTYFDRNEARTSWTMEEGTRYLTQNELHDDQKWYGRNMRWIMQMMMSPTQTME